jgi:hypothetical protein
MNVRMTRKRKIVKNRCYDFERRAWRCYNSRVPHGPSASAVLLRGIPPSENAQCTAQSVGSRFAGNAVRAEMRGKEVAR